MQLRQITFQMDGPSDQPFSKHYRAFMESECAASAKPVPPAIEAQQVELARRMRNLPIVTSKLKAEVRAARAEAAVALKEHFEHILQLIDLLESDFAGPPQWLCASHYDVVFYSQDYKEFPETDADSITITVRLVCDEIGKRKYTVCTGESEVEICDAREAAEAIAKMVNGRIE